MDLPAETWPAAFALRNEVVDGTHPDFEHYFEVAELERWIASGAPLDTSAAKSPDSVQHRPDPLAYSMKNAAEALGVSEDAFREHIQAELRIVRRGRMKRVAKSELQRWLDEAAERL